MLFARFKRIKTWNIYLLGTKFQRTKQAVFQPLSPPESRTSGEMELGSMGVGCFDGSVSDQAGLFLSLRGLADGWSRSGACRMTALVPPRRRRFRRLRSPSRQQNPGAFKPDSCGLDLPLHLTRQAGTPQEASLFLLSLAWRGNTKPWIGGDLTPFLNDQRYARAGPGHQRRACSLSQLRCEFSICLLSLAVCHDETRRHPVCRRRPCAQPFY